MGARCSIANMGAGCSIANMGATCSIANMGAGCSIANMGAGCQSLTGSSVTGRTAACAKSCQTQQGHGVAAALLCALELPIPRCYLTAP